MTTQFQRWGLTLGMALALLAAGCGGGAGSADVGGSGKSAAATMRVEPMRLGDGATEDASPFRKRRLDAAPQPHAVRLGKVSNAKLASETAVGPRVGTPRKIGFSRDLSQTASIASTAQRLQWRNTADGGLVAAISVSSDGAMAVRLGLWVRRMPWDATVRLYSQGSETALEVSGSAILSTIHRNLDADGASDRARTYWFPAVDGEEATLEIELPRGAGPDTVEVAIPRLSHQFESATDEPRAQAKSIGQAGVCENDISCTGSSYSIERDATAKMSFVASDGQSYVCSGTLLNDRQSSGTPYFLSANHCISLQSEASTLNTYWFYRSSACNSGRLSTSTRTLTRGATLLYASASTDTSFMQLNETPPAGVTYAGWDPSAPNAGIALFGVHHPSGDLQKISYGSLKGFTACTVIDPVQETFTCSSATQAVGNFISTQWTNGVTEAGSSGSGLYKSVGGTNYLIGQLYGGSSSCGAGQSATDDYGRFDKAYAAALSRWLDSATIRSAVFRFYNTSTSTHFYTISQTERDSVIATYPQFHYEGPAFYAYPGAVSGLSPVFRFYNTSTASHFYTISTTERDFVQATYPQFLYEGPRWYAQTSNSSSVIPVFRFYNTATSTHFYTVSPAERDYVMATYPQFTFEGISYYAWASAN